MSERQLLEAMRDLQRTVRRSMLMSATLSVLTAIVVCTALNYIHQVELMAEIQKAINKTTVDYALPEFDLYSSGGNPTIREYESSNFSKIQ